MATRPPDFRSSNSRSYTILGPVPAGTRWQSWILPTALARFEVANPNLTFARSSADLTLVHEPWANNAASLSEAAGGSFNCTCASRSRRRIAYIISLNPTRLRQAAHVLHSAGFAVTHVVPVNATTDPRVHAMERRYRLKTDQAPPYGAISNLLTHVDLWHAAPAGPEEEWAYVFEDDVGLHPMMDAARVQCVLDDAEAFGGNHTLLYLGSAAEHKRGPPHVFRQCGGTHSLQACAPLAFHAYAVRQSAGKTLWELIRYVVGPLTDVTKYNGYRYTVDIATRGFYWRGIELNILSPAHEWPRCLDVRTHGIFEQNASADASAALAHNWTAGFFRR